VIRADCGGIRAARAAALVCLALLALAPGPGSGQVLRCQPSEERALDRRLPESSGAAWSGTRADVFWTVNDGRDGELFAVDTLGRTVAVVDTDGPRLQDVEALAAGPCPSGRCIYLADTGDNAERRDEVAIHRIPEPDLSGTRGAGGVIEFADVERDVFRFRYPGGPVDVEGFFILPGDGLYLVAKGRRAAPAVFRYPEPLRPDETVTLEVVGRLGDGPASFTGRYTGAAAIPDLPGFALIRSYEALEMIRIRDGRAERVPGSRLNLRPLGEPQGEAVAVAEGGMVVLTSEEGPFSRRAEMRILRCTFDPPESP
jgi:hypothetical protein